jgi:hypothetical protein
MTARLDHHITWLPIVRRCGRMTFQSSSTFCDAM